MHGRVLAERRARAAQRLDESLDKLAARAGVTLPEAAPSNRPEVADLFRLEYLADVADALAGVKRLPDGEEGPGLDVTTLTVRDLLEARIGAVPRVDEEMAAAIVAAYEDEEAEEPFRDRLLALDGVGDATADAVVESLLSAGFAVSTEATEGEDSTPAAPADLPPPVVEQPEPRKGRGK